MKKKFYFLLLLISALATAATTLNAAPKITLTTSQVNAANVNQGSTSVLVYAVKMKVATSAVTINNIQFTLSGSHDNNDLTAIYTYFNASSPFVSGSSYLGGTTTISNAPHTYSVGIFKTMNAGDSGYFLITVNVSNTANDQHTIQINGKNDPVVFGYSVSSTVINSQSNIAGVQTIQAADITLTTSSVAALEVNQGATGNIAYIAKMNVSTEPVIVNNISFKLSGSQDNNDLTAIYVYYNAAAPVLSGASYLGGTTTIFDAPHTYSVGVYRPMAIGEAGYYIIIYNVSSTATDNHNLYIDGAADPVQFGFGTAPNVTNSQTNKAKKQTFQAADITLTTSSVAALDVNQGATGNIAYIAKMNVSTEPVIVNNISFKLSGSQDNNDLTAIYVYYNAAAPVLSGASYLGGTTTIFDAPHTYSVGVYRPMAIGEAGYYIITYNVSSTATDNHNLYIDGAADPVQFGFGTAPNVTNSQTNKAKKQTFQAADITLTTSSVAALDVNQGATGNIAYIAKMNVSTEPVIVNNISFKLSGSQDNNDLTAIYVYYNAAAPVLSGASYLGGTTTIFDAPHTYSVGVYRPMAIGEAGYYIITYNVSSTATDNHNLYVDGAADPVQFGFGTAPNVTNSQTNKAKKQTFQAADISLTTSTTAAGNIARSSTGNIIYALKSTVVTEPVIVNNISFNLTGSHDNNDLTAIYIYYNTTPVLSGASYLGGTTTIFDAPHTYAVGVYKPMAVNETGYFIITANVSGTADIGKTVKINGATDPVVLAYSTAPNITNNQSNNAGVKTISATFALSGNNGSSSADANTSERVVSGLYPNPANASFRFSITTQQSGIVKAQLSGRGGNIIEEKNIATVNGVTQSTFNVSAIPNGIYYLTVFNKEGTQVARQQVIVQH